MVIQQKDDTKKGSFFIEESGEIVAEMTYVWTGKNIIIDHTEVSEKLEGKGIGKQLVHYAVEYARKNNLKIMPLCPFTKKIIDLTVSYQDVLL